MTLPREEDRARVTRYIHWYGRHPTHLRRVLVRAEPFLYHILDEIERRGLPAELLLLPVVESGYRTQVLSHGHAAGIWQFIPSTGAHFGLKQNWWYDGRRDVHAATLAALTYLEQLHRRFDGDWFLALAAYNAGQGTVARAIRHNRARGRPSDYWQLDLPRETRHYVPRLLALATLLADPKAHGLSLPPVPDRPQVTLVRTGGQIELAVAARLAGIDLETLRTLNPGLDRWATPPKGPHHLLVPADRAPALRAGLAELDPGQRVTWRRHRVRRGEYLGGIAARYDLPVEALRRVNGIQGDLIRAGEHLLIPGGGDARAPDPMQAARSGEDRIVHHDVRPGDTLWALARHYGVSVRDLARWNDLEQEETLHPGQTLIIRRGSGAA
ncbi:LysM peptidoglycan-binding domain-containing protein [Ectothiorhodospira mobilis]|uniref:LysM peptidoglycan-binding domain-containing protein n=1 Tax=Ectothiorhodospira mobilis TaxID=195064 RepID=UPI001F5B2860|nr:LysM peptidoglycan-binding domain-containing protein [Ectothiorhodospira mobilis]